MLIKALPGSGTLRHYAQRGARRSISSKPARHEASSFVDMSPRSRMTRYALLSALTAVVALTASATAEATTAPRFKQAAFHATVKGVQTTTWTVNHPSTARCNPASHGSGSERVTFASSRVGRVKAIQIFGAPPVWAGSQGLPLLPTRGWVTRNGTLETAPSPPECAVGD